MFKYKRIKLQSILINKKSSFIEKILIAIWDLFLGKGKSFYFFFTDHITGRDEAQVKLKTSVAQEVYSGCRSYQVLVASPVPGTHGG